MKRVKKKKSLDKKIRKEVSTYDIVRIANELNLAIMIRTLYSVYGWRKKRLSDFLEGYLSLMREVADRRCSVKQMVKDTYLLTGFDVNKLLDDVYMERYKK